ncbi:MAG: glutaredoxin [Calditrichaeota bacterium]|nr:glutaredoxin [Calditrichota bacterium]
MTKSNAEMAKKSNKPILILRTRNCRKSNLVIRFLQNNNIPHEVKSLETDPEAQQIAKKLNILSSPGIVVNGQVVNPYELIENCQIKNPAGTKQFLEELLGAE